MSKKEDKKVTKHVFLTKEVVETFIREGNLNDRDTYIIKTRAKGYTIAKQARELNLSVDQVNKDIRRLKALYDEVQKKSDILPERKKNKRELEQLIK